MSKNNLVPTLRARPTLLTLALLAAFGSASAQDKDQSQVVEGSASLGAGLITSSRDERSLFDQYGGLRPGNSVFGVFGADYYRRDSKAGTLTRFAATDLLSGNRELEFLWKRQGDWAVSARYGELHRYDPYIPNTGLVDAGSFAPRVGALPGGPGTGGDVDLKVKRTSLGLGFQKVISSRLQFDASLSTENKEGARLFGIGMACPTFVAPGCRGTTSAEVGSAVLMLPEPIDANHSQAEARLTYAADGLNLSLGYYGSFYRNSLGALVPNVSGSLYNPLGALLPVTTGLQGVLNQPVALAPDNQAHQLDLTGGYAFSRTTNLNFKLAYSRATQQQNFAAAGFTAPAGIADLGGRMATTLAQVGVSSRPMPKLSLHGNLRYESRDDSTPLAEYGLAGTGAFANGFTNRQYPLSTLRGRAEAGYQFTPETKGTLAATFQQVDRRTFTASSATSGVTALRLKTEEAGLKAELRRRMSETLSAAVALEGSRRDGSRWLRDVGGRGVTEEADPGSVLFFQTGVFPVNLADRRREKLRLSADWQPADALSLQASAESGRDRYDVPSAYGVRKSGMDQVNLDATYAINEKWNVNGFVSRGRQELDQVRPAGVLLGLDNTSTMFGLGVTGKPTSTVEVGGNLSFLQDRSTYGQTLDANADAGSAALLAATGGLPDIVFRQTQFRVFAKYALDKQSSVRVDLGHQRSRWTDWAWNYNGVPFVYSDGTTLNYKTLQNVSFLGVTYTRRWQ